MTSHPRKKEHSGLGWIEEIIVFLIISYFKPDQEHTDEIHIDYWKYLNPK